jgi:hypothetical protein
MRKSAVGKKPKLGRPSKAKGDHASSRIVIMSTDAWNQWLDRAAEKLRTTRSGAIDQMSAFWAEHQSFEAPPKRI